MYKTVRINPISPDPPRASVLVIYTGGTLGMVYENKGKQLVPFRVRAHHRARTGGSSARLRDHVSDPARTHRLVQHDPRTVGHAGADHPR